MDVDRLLAPMAKEKTDACDLGDQTEGKTEVCDPGYETEDKTEVCDLDDNAIPQPVIEQEPSTSEPQSPDAAAPDTDRASSKRPRESSDEESEDDAARHRMRRMFLDGFDEIRSLVVEPEKIETTFADVHTHSSTIEALENATLSIRYPAAFSYGALSKFGPQSILLYGPPGTGKTQLVRALAKQARSKIISISGADINDKYVGVGEKKIKKVFALARKEFPCIIFVDEADSMFRSRSTERESNAQYLNEFLAGMDGIGSRGRRDPIVVAATNRPFDIDEGILRRLGKRILVGAPDVAAREEILKIHLRGETLSNDVDLSELARATADYTGADLKNLVYTAAMRSLREEMDQESPSPPTSDDTDSTESQIGCHRVLRKSHFLFAKRATPPAPISDTASKIREFHNKFGDMVQIHNGEDSRNKTKQAVNL